MAIIQISKIQQRAGNLVDLPQLDNAEFGWATDENRLFIGRTGNTVTNENIEVLTSYSNISFSQITGSDGGNFNITSANNGQILTYVDSTNTWENYPSTDIISANANFKLNLGNVEFLKINGGAIGYVLQTDGVGNLSWAPKGTLYTNINALTNNPTGNIITMTVPNTTPYTNDAIVTISGVLGSNAVPVNGQSFYIQLDTDFSISGNVKLYTTTGNGSPANGAGLTANANTGIATSLTGGSGGGTGTPGGVDTTVQYNGSGVLAGDAGFTFNATTKSITLTGNVTTANLYATTSIVSPILVSNVAVGTAPLTVTSTTRVANLNVAYANVSDFEVVTTQTTGTFYPTFVDANTTGNLALASNANLSFNAATGRLSATLLAGTLTTAVQPNITSVGTLTTLSVSGNANIGNITSGNATLGNAATANYFIGDGSSVTNVSAITSLALANGTSNVRIPTINGNINMSAAGNANIIVVTGTGANIAGTFNVSGNANVGNLGTSAKVIASILESNVATGTAPLTIASTTRVTNLNVAYANVTDFTAMSALTTGIYYPAFVNGTAAANYAQGSNTTFSANIANGVFTATGFSGNLITANITTGANTIQGNLTGNWVLTTGSKLQATYADLAEYYEADQKYEPGTVVEFGGEKEVTIAEDGTSRVAGVVSTDPAYAMNMKCPGIAVAIALQGRVPTKVKGRIRKGDMMVSAGNGFARPWNNPQMGTVIGKALENFDGIEGVIEVAVGRL